jgi:hypothetical protein
MGRRIGWIAAIVLVALTLGAGGVGYNLGVSHGLAIAAPAAGAPGMPPYMWYRPWGFGFGFGPLLFLFLFFFVFRSLLWGGYGRRHWRHAGCGGLPPTFDEWHRRAHEQTTNPQPQTPPRA